MRLLHHQTRLTRWQKRGGIPLAYHGRNQMSEIEAEDEKEKNLRLHYPPSRQPTTLFVKNFYATAARNILRTAFGESPEAPEVVRVVGEMVAEIEQDKATSNATDK